MELSSSKLNLNTFNTTMLVTYENQDSNTNMMTVLYLYFNLQNQD